jgi:hypothetical protein
MIQFSGTLLRGWHPPASMVLPSNLLLLLTLAFAGQPWLERPPPVRSWELLSCWGTRTGIIGSEQDSLSTWVDHLKTLRVKILRDFDSQFHLDGTTLAAAALARALIVRPQSSALVYTGDLFPSARLGLR